MGDAVLSLILLVGWTGKLLFCPESRTTCLGQLAKHMYVFIADFQVCYGFLVGA